MSADDPLVKELRRLEALLEKRTRNHSDTAAGDRDLPIRAALSDLATAINGAMAEDGQAPTTESFFDPGNPRVLGALAAIALQGQARFPLGEIDSHKFSGSGVYAIYYLGDVEHYDVISSTQHPIYVGKADPQDGAARTPSEQGYRLHRRLRDHKRSIERVSSSLRIEDFEVRFLVVASGWQSAAESALITLFRPLWNKETGLVYGFGKHGDSSETRKNRRSPWDVLHAGREWADSQDLRDSTTKESLVRDVRAHYGSIRIYRTREDVLEALMDVLRVQ